LPIWKNGINMVRWNCQDMCQLMETELLIGQSTEQWRVWDSSDMLSLGKVEPEQSYSDKLDRWSKKGIEWCSNFVGCNWGW